MDANQIIAALEQLPNGGSMQVSCSGGRNVASFAAATGIGRGLVRVQVQGELPGILDSGYAELLTKLQAAQQ